MLKKWKVFLPCYYTFLVNGMMALGVGAILPYLISEANLSYSLAGGMLSAFAIGNLSASFVNPFLIGYLGRKNTILCMLPLVPLSLFIVSLLPSVFIMNAAFFVLGVGRGSISIFNNTVVNEESSGSNTALNLLHMIFAIGAFISPFMTSFYIGNGWNWRYVVYTIIILFIISFLLLCMLPIENKKSGQKSKKAGQGNAYLKSPDFYIIGLILFFYLGLENCVNGWFVTYFKSTGIMSDSYATNLLSITWIAVMLGRLLTAYLSKHIQKKTLILINCILTALFFFLLISTNHLVIISIAIFGLGFVFAGIYPTCIANAGMLIQGSASGMSMLLAIASFGGIIAPKIVGVIADKVGLAGAITVLLGSTVFMVVFSIINFKRKAIR